MRRKETILSWSEWIANFFSFLYSSNVRPDFYASKFSAPKVAHILTDFKFWFRNNEQHFENYGIKFLLAKRFFNKTQNLE